MTKVIKDGKEVVEWQMVDLTYHADGNVGIGTPPDASAPLVMGQPVQNLRVMMSDQEPLMSREAMKQEPVLWMCHDCGGANQLCPHGHKDAPLYTAPPKKEWVGLTNEEINSVRYKRDWTAPWTDTTFARAIEAKLKEKNKW